MGNSPLISVIVPCYNQGQFLSEALQSVYNQTYSNWECIIVNDGSLDNTNVIASQWLKKDIRFKYIEQKNKGLSGARNFGINKSIGNFIVTLDADDKYESTFFEKAFQIIYSNKNIGIVSSWAIRFKGNKEIDLVKSNGKTINDFLFYNAAIGTSFFRKECWTNVEGYDEKMLQGYEDWEFYIRVCKLGWGVHIIQEPLFYYRQHNISMRVTAKHNHDSEIRKYIFNKHKELYMSNYEKMINYFLDTIHLENKQNVKIINRIEYKLGAFLLKPFRILKSLIRCHKK